MICKTIYSFPLGKVGMGSEESEGANNRIEYE